VARGNLATKICKFIADQRDMALREKIGIWGRGLNSSAGRLLGSWVLLLICAEAFGLGDYLHQHITSKVNFTVRRRAVGEGHLNPRIKIYAVDDPTAAKRGEVRLSGRDLVQVLHAIDAKSPRKIILDAMFSQRSESTQLDPALASTLASLKTPIITGVMIASDPIAHRTVIGDKRLPILIDGKDRAPSPIRRMKPAFIYGPEGAYLQAFNRFGHFVEFAEHYLAPVVLINDVAALPHLSVQAADSISVIDSELKIDGYEIALDKRGLLPIDYLSTDVIAPRIRSLGGYFSGDRFMFSDINSDDVVVILTEYTSGVTRFVSSPFGLIPGPFALISCLNSVLNKSWLRAVGYSYELILILSFVGLFIGFTTNPSRFFLLLAGCLTVTLACFLYLFIGWGIEVKWLLPMLGILGSAVIGLSEQRQRESIRRIFLESERKTAAVLQRDFLPALTANHASFELAATYIAAETIGGDWFAHGVIGDRWLYVHLGDVTGHGAASAMLASFAKGATDALHEAHRRQEGKPAPLALVHECLNQIMRTSSGENLYMTMLSIIIDLHTGHFCYLNSGHEPAFVVQDAKITVLSSPTNNLLGHTSEAIDTRIGSSQIKADDMLILFSDGLLDATCPVDKKPSLRLLTKLIHSADISSAAGLRNLLDLRCTSRLDASAKAKFSDDVTFVIVKLKNNAEASDATTGQEHQSA